MREPQPPAYTAVREVHGTAVHEGAATDDRLDAQRRAELDRAFRDAAGSKRAVEPDLADSSRVGLAHKTGGDVRMRGEHQAVELPGNRREVGITGDTLELSRVGIDGNNVEAGVPELAKDRVGRLLRRTGYARDGKAPALKETRDRVGSLHGEQSRPTTPGRQDSNDSDPARAGSELGRLRPASALQLAVEEGADGVQRRGVGPSARGEGDVAVGPDERQAAAWHRPQFENIGE